ncbi:MAG: DNA primase, partial [Bacteroidota bacterium]
VLSEGLGAYAVTLPAGHDPDSYVKEHGADALHQHVANTRSDLPQFMVNQAREAGRMQTPEDRVEVQSEVVAAVAAIPDPNLRREYVRQAADVLDVPPGDLLADLERQRDAQQQKQRRRSRRSRPSPPPPQDNGTPSASPRTPTTNEGDSQERDADRSYRVLPEERLLLRLMLEKGGRMIQYVLSHMALDEFSEGPVRKLVQCLMQMYKDGSVQPDRILRGEEGPALQQLAASVRVDEYSPSENWEHRRDIRVPRLNERPYEAAASAMTLLKLDRVDEALRDARADIRRADREGVDDLTPLQNRLMKLTNLRKHIQNRDYLNDPPTG